jgi:hypothetical protein
MRFAFLFAIAAAFPLAIAAQSQPEKPTPENPARDKPRDPVRDLADFAMAAPPELAADLLIKISTSPKATDKALKIEWLERAFALAPGAHFKLRRSPGFGRAAFNDTDAGAMVAATDAEIDTLSLQSRIVQAMLRVDRAKAMDLFRSMPPLAVPPLTCKDAAGYNVATYYDLIRAVYQAGFTEQERKDGKDVVLLESVIAQIDSPFELTPAANMLVNMSLPNDVFSESVNRYELAIRRLQPDPRSFGLTVFPVFAQNSMIEAQRAYIVANLGGARCGDDVASEPRGKEIENGIDNFNQLLDQFRTAHPSVALITAEERKPSRVDDKMDLFEYWQTARTRKLLTDLQALRGGPGQPQGSGQTADQRGTPQWDAKVRDYLKNLEDWKSSHDESETNYFHMSAELYSALIQLIPPGQLRSEVLRSDLAFLRQSALERENPAEWLKEVNQLIRSNPNDADRGQNRNEIRDEIKASGDAVMSLYIDVAALTPPSAGPR